MREALDNLVSDEFMGLSMKGSLACGDKIVLLY